METLKLNWNTLKKLFRKWFEVAKKCVRALSNTLKLRNDWISHSL